MLELKEYIEFKSSDISDNGYVKAARILFYFQEIAAAHATDLGIGYDDLIKDDRIWVLSKVKYKLNGKISLNNRYIIETYPRGKKGVIYLRDYYIKDETGKVIAAGESHWCVINFKTRRVERADLQFGDDFIETEAIPEGIERIKLKAPVKVGAHVVQREDLDVNEHTNNCRYADMIGEITGRDDYREFNIHFVKESRLGDAIDIYREDSEQGELFTGRLSDGSVIFQAKVI